MVLSENPSLAVRVDKLWWVQVSVNGTTTTVDSSEEPATTVSGTFWEREETGRVAEGATGLSWHLKLPPPLHPVCRSPTQCPLASASSIGLMLTEPPSAVLYARGETDKTKVALTPSSQDRWYT